MLLRKVYFFHSIETAFRFSKGIFYSLPEIMRKTLNFSFFWCWDCWASCRKLGIASFIFVYSLRLMHVSSFGELIESLKIVWVSNDRYRGRDSSSTTWLCRYDWKQLSTYYLCLEVIHPWKGLFESWQKTLMVLPILRMWNHGRWRRRIKWTKVGNCAILVSYMPNYVKALHFSIYSIILLVVVDW